MNVYQTTIGAYLPKKQTSPITELLDVLTKLMA
jgi:hypothetical protein